MRRSVGRARAKYCWIASPSTVPIAFVASVSRSGPSPPHPMQQLSIPHLGENSAARPHVAPSRQQRSWAFFHPVDRKERRSHDGHGGAKSWVLSDQHGGLGGTTIHRRFRRLSRPFCRQHFELRERALGLQHQQDRDGMRLEIEAPAAGPAGRFAVNVVGRSPKRIADAACPRASRAPSA
jgi:hypothetical protein